MSKPPNIYDQEPTNSFSFEQDENVMMHKTASKGISLVILVFFEFITV